MRSDFYNPNLTFGSIPTTCYRNERPAFFHSGEKPKDTDDRLEAFLRGMVKTVKNDKFTFIYDGKPIMAHPKWIRDHIHELKAFKHWDGDLKEYVELMCKLQREDGQFYEMVQLPTNYHWNVVNDTNRIKDEKNGLVFVRVELEADIEYLMVEAVWQIYQVTGDVEWVKKVLPALEKGINYMTSDPRRFDKKHGLCIRPFTIDTWDFVYDLSTLRPKDVRNICPGVTPMSIMHGDNSGIFAAMKKLSAINGIIGNSSAAEDWENRAEKIRKNLNKYCWNGNFYTHQVHVNHQLTPKEDEENRLSFSNTYDINRKVTTFEQASKIISEYIKRRETSGCFAEWFTINPPYEHFRGGYDANNYVNGCIASLAAGELALAAFNNGFEAYGWDIISRLIDLFEKDGELFFLYDMYNGKNKGGGPSGWGAAAIIAAVDEGLAGFVDTGVQFDTMRFQPRWRITDREYGKYITGYESSGIFAESSYKYYQDADCYRLAVPSNEINCHILLKQNCDVKQIVCNGKSIEFATESLSGSMYANFVLTKKDGIEIENSGGQFEYYFEIIYAE